MRISEVRVETVEIPFVRPVVSAGRRWEVQRTGILLLTTEAGHTALGEFPAAWPDDLGEDAAGRMVAALEGIELADPVTVEGRLREIDRWPFVGRAARSAAESALVDLLAQVRGQTVSTYLAGEGPTVAEVAVNAMLDVGSARATAARAAELVRAGFACLKLKAGDESAAVLEARVGAVRERVGPEVALRLDFNGALAAEPAAALLEGLTRFDVEYVEQPIPPGAGAEALARLRRRAGLPIAADEAVRDVGSARALLEAEAADVLVVKPSRVGGLRQAAAIVELAADAGVAVTVSTLFETGVGLAGALHLAATVPGRRHHGLATADLLASDLLAEPLAIVAGRMKVPAGPGLGVTLDEGALERYRAA